MPIYHPKIKLTRSPAYDYFTKSLAEGTQTCNTCGFVMKGTNTTSAKQHLEGKHKDIYQDLIFKNRQAKEAANAMQTHSPQTSPADESVHKKNIQTIWVSLIFICEFSSALQEHFSTQISCHTDYRKTLFP